MPPTTLSRPEDPMTERRRTPALAFLQPALPGCERVAAFILTLLAGYLHFHLLSQHHPLWRDEVTTAQLASLPSWAETWTHLSSDSCPILFPELVRAWAAALPPGGDWQLRLLGFGVGLSILGACWLCARRLGGTVPLLSVALLSFNPAFVRYGDSVRPYGLGIFLVLAFFLAVWRVVEAARPGRILLAAVAGVLAVNALFYNAVLVLAVCVSGAAVVAREKRGKHAVFLLAIGLPAALSLLFYLPMIHAQHRWSFLLYFPVTVAWLWKRVSEITGSPDPLGIWIWAVLCVGLSAWAARHLLIGRRGERGTERGERATAFALGTLVVGTIAYGGFLIVLKYATQPWYYVTLLAVAAVCLDVLAGRLVATAGGHAPGWRLARLACVLVFPTLTYLPAKQDLVTRPTNLDRIAGVVAARAGRGDLIVHSHWECAITFGHYYHGDVPQETLPPLPDHRLHRYDLVLAQMMTRDAIQPVLDRMGATLRAGHRIWFIGEPIFPRAHRLPVKLEPLVISAHGPPPINRGDCAAWVMQASYFLEQHAQEVEIVPVPTPGPVSKYEELPLSALQGWRNTEERPVGPAGD